MMTRRDSLKFTLGAAAAGSTFGLSSVGQVFAAEGALSYQVFQAGPSLPVVLSGAKDAFLVSGGFTMPDVAPIAEAIKASGKALKIAYVSCNDPDYYFGLRPIVDAFPKVEVLAQPVTVEKIKANVQGKLDVWGPVFGDGVPKTVADVVMPAATEAKSFDLDGHTIEVVEVPDMTDRQYLWVPSIEGVFGGVLVWSGTHVWLADTATPALREAWIAALDGILARDPKVVIPQHSAPGAAQGVEAVRFTKDYLIAVEEALKTAKTSDELVAAMTARYPDLPDVDTLTLGAKVVTGEMPWG